MKMNESTVKQYLETVFKLDGLEFMFNDGEKIVFSSPIGDVVVCIETRKVYDHEENLIGEISSMYNMG
ncbi:hypothetical protein [Bacillus halotolerans]|uniref:hypothetical protein n=1 Tax=Bacillus halotolerans TaxID=260554 RepID=UPI000D076BB7|nr:hypothetical protein [Bacillus halotolerans]PSB00052.1 hypothetical protein C6372_05035 [Bacillus halotolerans]WJE41221.1 hypothetical protein QRD86_00260 [Bacillus halotolerans]